jgi:hypothetical protein
MRARSASVPAFPGGPITVHKSVRFLGSARAGEGAFAGAGPPGLGRGKGRA